MLKQAKNKIVCDECEKDIPVTKDLIESKHIHGGIRINFFRCRSCGTKYIVDVTDIPTRLKQHEYSKMVEEQNKIVRATTKDNLEEMTEISEKLINDMEKLLQEIKECKAELKEKYEVML